MQRGSVFVKKKYFFPHQHWVFQNFISFPHQDVKLFCIVISSSRCMIYGIFHFKNFYKCNRALSQKQKIWMFTSIIEHFFQTKFFPTTFSMCFFSFRLAVWELILITQKFRIFTTIIQHIWRSEVRWYGTEILPKKKVGKNHAVVFTGMGV